MIDRDHVLEDLGHRIRTAREGHGVTQTELGQAAGLHRASIANLEAGRQSPSLITVVTIAERLHTTVGHLLGEPS